MTVRRVEIVCPGNICRSPIGEVVLRAKLAEAGIDDVVVTSSGTGGWHAGDPMDPRAAAALRRRGYDGSAHRAQQFRTGLVRRAGSRPGDGLRPPVGR